MSALFFILFLAALGFLVWGVMNPASLSKYSKKPLTRRDAGVGFGVIALVMFVLTGVTAPDTTSQQKTGATDTKNTLSQSQAKELKPEPVVTTDTVTETQEIAFGKTSVNDSTRTKGTSMITTAGVNGIKSLTYQVTKTDGVETNRKLVKEAVTAQPITEVTSIGTKVVAAAKPKSTPAPSASSGCDPNYSGACVPIASDVDCGSGSGNGPAYVYSVVTVIGSDIYGLDANHNGLGCE